MDKKLYLNSEKIEYQTLLSVLTMRESKYVAFLYNDYLVTDIRISKHSHNTILQFSGTDFEGFIVLKQTGRSRIVSTIYVYNTLTYVNQCKITFREFIQQINNIHKTLCLTD